MPRSGEQAVPGEVAIAKALSHPLRFRLLQHYNQAEVASPSELAKQMDANLGDVSYHTRVLRDLGCLELVRTEPRRGAQEHYYRATVRPWIEDTAAAAMPADARAAIVSGVAGDIWADVTAATSAGGFDRPDIHISRTPLELDREGWTALSRLLAEVLDQALAIQEESKARLERDPSAAEPAELAMLHFARPPE